MTKATESAAVETALATPFDFTTRDVAKKAEEGAELEVLDPVTNEPVGVFITLAGADSAIHRKATATIAKRRLSNTKGFRNRALDPRNSRRKASKCSPPVRSAGRASLLTARPSVQPRQRDHAVHPVPVAARAG